MAFQNTLTLLVLLCHNHEKMIQHSNTNFRYDIEGGEKLHCKVREGRTALHRASIGGHDLIVKFLLEKSSDPKKDSNIKDQNEFSPLSYAAANGHVNVMRLLLDVGANMSYRDKEGWTALMHASHNSHFDAVKLLLERGADVNQESGNRLTALIEASKKGHGDIVRLLLKYGAEKTHKDNDNRNALLWAIHRNHEGVIQVLRSAGGKGILQRSLSDCDESTSGKHKYNKVE